MRTNNLYRFIIICAALIALLNCVPAAACIPRQSLDLLFEKNSSELSKDQLAKLSAWVTDMNRIFPNQDLLRIGAIVEVGEHEPEQLGRRRELAVRLALIDLKFFPDVVRSSDKIFISGSRAKKDPLYEDVKRVELEFTPGCPRACGGCPNMTPIVNQCGVPSFIAANFQWNSSSLLSPQRIKLENWARIIHADHPNMGVIQIDAGADENEENPANLNARRVEEVRQVLIRAGFQAEIISQDMGMFAINTGPGMHMRTVATRAEITFTLPCPE